MEEIYAEVREDPLYQRLFELTNVHTAEQFGLDVPDSAYEQMAQGIESENEWMEIQEEDWFRSAQVMAEEETFFHWELEFPEVFFNKTGKRRDYAGFDAVIGNPPYIRVQNLRQANPNLVRYLESEDYTTSEGRYDIYAPFVERGSQLAADGYTGYILPNKFIESGGGKPLRKYLTENHLIKRIVDFGEHQIFDGVTTYTCILLLQQDRDTFEYINMRNLPDTVAEIRSYDMARMKINSYSSKPWVLTDPEKQSLLKRIQEKGKELDSVADEILQGMKSGDNGVSFVEILKEGDMMEIRSPANGERYEIESDLIEPIVLGKHIHRYKPPETNLAVVYPYKQQSSQTEIIPELELKSEYPRTYSYLSDFEQRLRDRQTEHMRYETWYALNRPRNKEFFENPKVIVPDICEQSEFTIDNDGSYYIGNTGYGVVPTKNNESMRHCLLAILNSSMTWFYIYHTSTVLENDFRRFLASYLGPLPIPHLEPELDIRESEITLESKDELADVENPASILSHLGKKQTNLHKEKAELNLSIFDHLASYSDGQTIAEIGLAQPPKGTADSILQQTTEQKPNLRVGEAEVIRRSTMTVEIRLTARYKPGDEDTHETDRWGYTETEPLPALRITDLTETEADLIEAFLPVAIDEAGGFANFRETATKTNSLVDRLRKLTLPAVNDVQAGLESYLETKTRAEELEEKIERTDELIDKIVYVLYGLTDEEIEIVEEAVGE